MGPLAPLALGSVTDYNVLELLRVDIVAIPIKRPVATTGLFLFKKPAATLAFFLSVCWLIDQFATEQVNASDLTQIL